MLRRVAKRLLGGKTFGEFKDRIRTDTNFYDAYNYITELARKYKMDVRRDLEVLSGNLVAEFLRWGKRLKTHERTAHLSLF